MQDKPFDIQICLKDIEQAITEINEFLPMPRIFSEFQKDLKTRKAVERNIEINCYQIFTKSGKTD